MTDHIADQAQPPPAPADLTGLTEEQALARLAAEGPNTLPSAARRSPVQLLGDVLREPMLALLLAAGVIYLVLGDLQDASMLLAFAAFSVSITIFQERRADRAIEALGRLARPQVVVIRSGERVQIPSANVVREDLVILGEGVRIPADGWLLEASGLQADEAVLTGESVPVAKSSLGPSTLPDAAPVPGGDGLAYAFSGTLVVSGNGILRVAATGPRTRIGMIGQLLFQISTEAPRLTVQTRRLVRWFAVLGLSASVLAGLFYGLRGAGWLDAVLAGIAISMSLLPEELPVVLTLFLTMGAFRMSRARVLVRRGAAIESLGAATVLCTDKTGTLTQNRMAIAELRLPDGRRFVPGGDESPLLSRDFVELAGLGVLASLEKPLDPMEVAFHELAEVHGEDAVNWRQRQGWTLHQQYPLSPELLAVSHVWRGKDGERVVAAKGAPEAIAELCSMSSSERATLDRDVAEMASKGLRVLGVAEAVWTASDLPEDQSAFDFVFRGLAGLADPIRSAVRPAIAELQDAGVRVVMITGDYPLTARAIAGQAGIREREVMSGPELAALDDARLPARIGAVSVFARIMADQKFRIVEALKARGEVVAMIGDGVNDAPSLKAAHIGVAMGQRGTDVAREAASIVLLDDNFDAIPAAVRLGRRIYDNLRKAMAFIFAVHVPIAGLALAPLLFGWPIILGPAHIALLEMVIDPACALAFEAEPEEAGIMRRPPRDPRAPLFPGGLLAWSIVQGAVALGLSIALTSWAFARPDFAIPEARAVAFAGLVAAVLVLILVNRSFGGLGGIRGLRRNLPLAAILLAASAVFALLFEVEPVARLLHFGIVPVEGMAAVGLSSAILWATLRLLQFRLRKTLAR